MWPTAEVRWFGRGEVPQQVGTWLRAHGLQLHARTPRTDHYLRLPDVTSLGVKLREGRIEVKQAAGPAAETRFGPRAAGICQRWRKWSFPLLPGHEASIALSPNCWVPVRKRRDLLCLELGADGSLRSLPEEAAPAWGCLLELAGLETRGARWWSLAFEAFGGEALIDGTLYAVAGRLLEGEAAPVLEVATSWSYPHWLSRIGRPESP